MAVSLSPLSESKAERNILEVDQQSRSQEVDQQSHSQPAVSEQQYQDPKEKFPALEATASSLAIQLQKSKREGKDIIGSMLGEKLQIGEELLAERTSLAERLRECNIVIQSQDEEMTLLREQLQEGKCISLLLLRHLRGLLNNNNHQRQDFQEQLAEGHRLAECLACMLSPEVQETEEDRTEEEPPAPSGVQKENVNEVLQDSSDEGCETSSRLHDPSESQQPPCSTTLSDEQDVSAPCVAREDPSYKENPSL
ncbi:putative neuroblastoma breakpoint family member 5 [Tupaia chinensis]|uniref:putative neuroblastoma breakpoint family member 5 n=1 Tax=Tupaia chinensis TaxID=246437 RepID=UPI0003C8D09D|nr:putative neuroblastoma breakpoint family member 5 [Tupaia chinensis]